MRGSRIQLVLVVASRVATGGLVMLAGQQAPGGPFTAAQAAAGRTAYQAQLRELPPRRISKARGDAAPLAGSEFMDAWGRRSTRELLSFMQLTMPPTRPGALSQEEYVNIAAFILQSNGAPAGNAGADAERAMSRSTRSREARRRRAAAQHGAGRGARSGRAAPPAADADAAAGAAGRHHRRRRSEELRPGHRGDAAQSGSGRLADDPPRLPRLGLQPAQSDHRRQREGSAPAVDLGDERRRRQPARADRPQRRHLSSTTRATSCRRSTARPAS